jgi:signal transduction histidine kinase
MNNIKEIIEDSIRLLSASAKSKNIQLESTSQTEPIGWFDRNMMSVVVRNLTSNAIKFTNDGGKIKISVFDDRDDPQNKLLVEVKDTGVGIKDELISEIFSNGALLTTRGTGFEQGSGLGLKLCREFVERNGGKIWAESEPAVGSRFIFTLPRKAASVL